MDDISPTFGLERTFSFNQEDEVASQVSNEEEEVDPEEVVDPDPDNISVVSQTSSVNSNNTMSGTTPQVGTIIVVGGEEINVDDTISPTDVKTVVLFPKAKRESMSEEKRNDFLDKVTRTKLTKFDLMSLTLSDEDKLDDTCSIGILVQKMRNHLQKYDCIDVFNIVAVDKADKAKVSADIVNLFEHYSVTTEKMVAESNRWYKTYTVPNYYRENLQITLDFLENNCTESLWEKVIETHDEFDAAERGGPLAFLIMMRMLQSHTDAAVQYLLNSVKNLKITAYEGENVSKVVSLIRGATRRLKSVLTNLPEEYPQWVLYVMQTSTVPSFNQSFAHLQQTVEVVEPLLKDQVKPIYPSVEIMLRMAEKRYLDLASTNEWTGVGNKASPSSFFTKEGERKLVCWNCGGTGHSVKECTKPLNQDNIEKRRVAFNEERKKNKKGKEGKDGKKGNGGRRNNKWAPPQPSEKNRRTINGKPMYWHAKTERWVDDRKAGQTPGANAAMPGTVSQPPPPSPPAPVTNPNPGRDLAVSNATHQINVAVQGLMNAYS